ncbi:YbhB/YbcL family Raf kinase inhibitor-like protein [Tsuneonella mangrovi]|uniref:YbhB/YbcL family Raf kinase inhibitor-like protein n=1 Tax=Tsuneonella mangrovi TaxID=1982042 RepID=UPI000BA27FBF|nr:YbhB/YbcL family Raf kinase inhibitor-like protein [Tsuneonella mangrovi]
MADTVPAWLAPALRSPRGAPRPAHGRLAIARMADEKTLGRGGFTLSSPAFRDGEELDPCFTADEEDAVAPPLEWTAPPPGAHELVLVVEDPDAVGDDPFVHWLVWGLPAQKGKLLEGEVPPRVGKNGFGNSEWLLPQPPHDDEAHDYVFQLFALDLPLTLMPGAGKDEVFAAIDGHVVAAAVCTGSYARSEAEEDWTEGDDFD